MSTKQNKTHTNESSDLSFSFPK